MHDMYQQQNEEIVSLSAFNASQQKAERMSLTASYSTSPLAARPGSHYLQKVTQSTTAHLRWNILSSPMFYIYKGRYFPFSKLEWDQQESSAPNKILICPTQALRYCK
mmetsp:Transcript_46312/g.82763  ORF Transcript_46312/g.82763 Transcript_46312/m.82763 type:complete len:108 (-) Transcript_46312:12-335(-)